MNSGDIGFMLICSALVLLMTPGLAFFYGGLVRRKNVVNTMMTSIFVIGIAAVMWALFGYSLAFGNDHFGIIGDFSWLGLQGIEGSTTDYVSTIPHLEFAIFQMMFAIITPALITGAVAGRMKFKALFLFIILWSVIVYYPMAHMVWGLGGFFSEDWFNRLCWWKCCPYQFWCQCISFMYCPRKTQRLFTCTISCT